MPKIVGRKEIIHDSIVKVISRAKDKQTETALNSDRVQTANRYQRGIDVKLERLHIESERFGHDPHLDDRVCSSNSG